MDKLALTALILSGLLASYVAYELKEQSQLNKRQSDVIILQGRDIAAVINAHNQLIKALTAAKKPEGAK